VLFLVCMMSLQAPRRRGEERFELDEPVWIIGPGGTISSGRTKDLSLSGVRLEAHPDNTPAARAGDSVRIFFTEVGFVSGTVVRQMGQSLTVKFTLPPSVERDLLIRKMFTAGRDTTDVKASAWSVTTAMLKSMWTIRTKMLESPAEKTSDGIAASLLEKLPAQTLVVSPQPRPRHLTGFISRRTPWDDDQPLAACARS
jgi:cellulose synthase (UDP-forming)